MFTQIGLTTRLALRWRAVFVLLVATLVGCRSISSTEWEQKRFSLGPYIVKLDMPLGHGPYPDTYPDIDPYPLDTDAPEDTRSVLFLRTWSYGFATAYPVVTNLSVAVIKVSNEFDFVSAPKDWPMMLSRSAARELQRIIEKIKESGSSIEIPTRDDQFTPEVRNGCQIFWVQRQQFDELYYPLHGPFVLAVSFEYAYPPDKSSLEEDLLAIRDQIFDSVAFEGLAVPDACSV